MEAHSETAAEEKMSDALRDGSLWRGAFEMERDGEYYAGMWRVVDASLAEEVNPPQRGLSA